MKNILNSTQPVTAILKSITETKTGMVLYSDGGASPTNPGFMGWGVHGYVYETTLPKKGAGNQTHILTAKGYVGKSSKGKPDVVEVKPISYLDGFGSSPTKETNNVAEIRAMSEAFHKASDFKIDSLLVLTDSDYVKKGVMEWHFTWVKRNWIRIDGTAVPNAVEWKILLQRLEVLRSRGVEVVVDWVRSHTDDSANAEDQIIGNIIADKLATIGVLYSKKSIIRGEFKEQAAEGYWKEDVEKHPFINHRRMYFNTTFNSLVKGEYYLGNHGKDDDLLGAKIGDNSFSVVQLKEPDDLLESIRQYQTQLAGITDSIVMVRLDKLYSSGTHKDLVDYGPVCLTKSSTSLDLFCMDKDKDPLTKELRPAKLAMRAVEALVFLKSMLDRYKQNDVSLQYIDITDTFYEKEVKKKKDEEESVYKFKSKYNVGFCALPVEFKIQTETGVTDIKLTLTLGIDLLDRNALKRLETLQPKITLVVWRAGPDVLRYVTVAESMDSYGVWGGVYSNMLFIPKG